VVEGKTMSQSEKDGNKQSLLQGSKEGDVKKGRVSKSNTPTEQKAKHMKEQDNLIQNSY